MQFEWGERKDTLNHAKHGVSFEEAIEISDWPCFTRKDDRAYGEIRDVILGIVGTLVVLTVVHTDRGGTTRLISARLANKKERRLYYDYLRRAIGRT